MVCLSFCFSLYLSSVQFSATSGLDQRLERNTAATSTAAATTDITKWAIERLLLLNRTQWDTFSPSQKMRHLRIPFAAHCFQLCRIQSVEKTLLFYFSPPPQMAKTLFFPAGLSISSSSSCSY